MPFIPTLLCHRRIYISEKKLILENRFEYGTYSTEPTAQAQKRERERERERERHDASIKQ